MSVKTHRDEEEDHAGEREATCVAQVTWITTTTTTTVKDTTCKPSAKTHSASNIPGPFEWQGREVKTEQYWTWMTELKDARPQNEEMRWNTYRAVS